MSKKSVTPDVALDALDESIKVLIDTRKVISDELRKIEGEKKTLTGYEMGCSFGLFIFPIS